MSKLIIGMHEAPPDDIMPDGGWILHLVEVGHGDQAHPGIDLRRWSGYSNILRIQHAWGRNAGTFPLPGDLDNYLARVVSLVRNSQGCTRWLIGNEPNIKAEWPSGRALFPDYVAQIYNLCRARIHALPGHKDDEVILPAIGPWNIATGRGWVEYFEELIELCHDVDAFAIHTYSRGPDPRSITSEAKMGFPWGDYYAGFRTYRDWMHAIPARYNDRPVYATETNQNEPWTNVNRGWVKAAYKEINAWNQRGNQPIRALILYRWPQHDPYYINGKWEVVRDFQEAQALGYTWTQPPPKRTIEMRASLVIDGVPSGVFEGTLKEVIGS